LVSTPAVRRVPGRKALAPLVSGPAQAGAFEAARRTLRPADGSAPSKLLIRAKRILGK
jgi:hypothetical protein